MKQIQPILTDLFPSKNPRLIGSIRVVRVPIKKREHR